MIAPAKLEAEFTNQYGERFVLRVDPTRQRGELLGDETDWKPIDIADDTIQADFIFGDDEWTWLSAAWQQFTGRPLQAPAFTRFRGSHAATAGRLPSGAGGADLKWL